MSNTASQPQVNVEPIEETEGVEVVEDLEPVEGDANAPTRLPNQPTVRLYLENPTSTQELLLSQYLSVERRLGLDKLTPEEQVSVIRELAKP